MYAPERENSAPYAGEYEITGSKILVGVKLCVSLVLVIHLKLSKFEVIFNKN